MVVGFTTTYAIGDPEKTTDLPYVTDKLYHVVVLLALSWS
jgi:hypothetical protein